MVLQMHKHVSDEDLKVMETILQKTGPIINTNIWHFARKSRYSTTQIPKVFKFYKETKKSQNIRTYR